jgi:hypothetical protein
MAGKTDPRCRFLSAHHASIRPVALALPESYTVGALDGQTAFVTPLMANHSTAVDAGGRQETLAEWPHPIHGERRGAGGTAVGWSGKRGCYLMRRTADGAPVDIIVPPFAPSRAVIMDDGGVYWSASTGGLWHWAPTGELTCLAATPPVVGLQLTAHGIRLDPVAVDSTSRWQREALAVGWFWRFDTERLEEVDLGPQGPAWGFADAGDAWAAAHPATDMIRVGDRDGARFDIACVWPIDVAWAGGSLLAATAHGDVLLFEDVKAQLF